MDSLFYVKTKISDNCEINTAISCDNVFAQCNLLRRLYQKT